MKPKFKKGDKVRVIKYGHIYWEGKNVDDDLKFDHLIISETDNFLIKDASPELVGKIGVVNRVSVTQNKPSYSLSGIKEKYAWYDEGQLELVNNDVNNFYYSSCTVKYPSQPYSEITLILE